MSAEAWASMLVNPAEIFNMDRDDHLINENYKDLSSFDITKHVKDTAKLLALIGIALWTSVA